MDGILGMGFIAGVVFTLIVVLCMVFIFARKDEDDSIPKGTPNGSDSVRASGDNVDNADRSIHMDNWNFDKGSEEEMEELEKIAHGLYVMKMVTGLCWTEKEILDKARLYIEREING